MKRYMYLWHRWLGIALCLFMALWFVSGVVMLYVGYPKLTPQEHLSRLPALSPACCIEPAVAVGDQPLASLRLHMLAGSPHYLPGHADGSVSAIHAGTGAGVSRIDAEHALASARQFAGGNAAEYLSSVQEDVWSHSRALDAHRPLHRVRLDDAEQRLLYISSTTGEVVRDATRQERIWNWAGAWLHWLYPLRGGWFDRWWSGIVIYLSVAATLMAVLGMLVGLLRWRFGGVYRNGSHSPYRGGFQRWHHIGGLLFGLLLIAWIFSGLMSMRPWNLLDNRSQASPTAYQGASTLQLDDLPPLNQALQQFAEAGFSVHQLEWRMLAGTTYLVAHDAQADSRILRLENGQHPVRAMLPEAELLEAARRMLPNVEIESEWLNAYDFHYYARAEQSMYGAQNRRLPVLRVRYDDAAGTWAHIDPYSGRLIEQLDQRRRLARSLFNLLHSWDWQPLLARPVLRETLIILFSLGGLVISLSGVVLGWRRLTAKQRRRRAGV